MSKSSNISVRPQDKTELCKSSPHHGHLSEIDGSKKRKPSVKIMEEIIPPSSAGPAAKNTERPNRSRRDLSGISPTRGKKPKKRSNDQERTISGKPLIKLPDIRVPENPASKDLTQIKKRSEQVTSYSPKHKVELQSETTEDKTVVRKTYPQHWIDVEVERQIGNSSVNRDKVTSAVLDYLTSESFRSQWEQCITREISSRIAKAITQRATKSKVQNISWNLHSNNKPDVQTKAPARRPQKELSRNLGFNQCMALLIGSTLTESRDLIMEELQGKLASNNATKMVGNVFESIIASVINGNRLKPDESTDADYSANMISALAARGINRTCERILHIIDSTDIPIQEPTGSAKSGEPDFSVGRQEASLLKTIMEQDDDTLDVDQQMIGDQKHARRARHVRKDMLVPSPSSTKKPGSKKKTKPEWYIPIVPHPIKLKSPPARLPLLEKGECSSEEIGFQKRKLCHFQQSISPLSPGATGDLNYLFRPAPASPAPRPINSYVGGVGWGIEYGFRLNDSNLLSNHQLKRSEFCNTMEDRLSQMCPKSWQDASALGIQNVQRNHQDRYNQIPLNRENPDYAQATAMGSHNGAEPLPRSTSKNF